MGKYIGNILTDGAATGYSCAFNGAAAGNYLSGTGPSLASGDWTIECWVNLTTLPSAWSGYYNAVLFSNIGSLGSRNGLQLQIVGSGATAIGLEQNSSYAEFALSSALKVNTWYHIAITRTSGNLRCFVNGVQQGSTTAASTTGGNTAFYIGQSTYGASYAYAVNGYISNFRIVTSSLYTTNFTPPTQLFAIANTALLTCQQPTIIDVSSNAVAITVNGTVTVSTVTPFPAFQYYNPALGGGGCGIITLNEAMKAAFNQQSNMYDPYWKNVTLMLNGDGTNGAQNNTFLDSSTNNFTITRNGNTTQGTFSPYGNLWSNYINSGWLNTPATSALEFGSGDFTLEGWIFPTDSGRQALYHGSHTADWSLGIDFQSQKVCIWASSNGTSWNLINADGGGNGIGTITVPLNQWSHFAFVRSGTTWQTYINGVRDLNLTGISGSIVDRSSYQKSIGKWFFTSGSGNPGPWAGYISNFRANKGTALYTSNFTPSTTPLTAVSGTALLTCQSNRFIDNSNNNFTLTVGGTPSVQRFGPFNPTAPYSAATIGGSGYFDGSGDYLVASSATSSLSGDFTIEFWWYPMTAASGYNLFTGPATYSGQNYFGLNGTSWIVNIVTGSEQTLGTFNGQINAWQHVALVRSGSSIKLYINGVGGTAVTNANAWPRSGGTNIGGYGSSSYPMQQGYLSNFRVVDGTAVYTTNFTPPTSPVTAVSGTYLLTDFTNAGIPDAAMMNDLETVGNAQVSTSVKKYGTGSIYVPYDTSAVRCKPNDNKFAFGTGSFTIESWINISTAVPNGWLIMGSQDPYTSDGASFGWGLGYNVGTSDSKFEFWYNNNQSSFITIQSTNTFSTGTWYHVAVTYDGATLRLFVDGVLEASSSGSYNNTNTALNLLLSFAPIGGARIGAYFDDVRITKGYARYTANFTPPTSALQNF